MSAAAAAGAGAGAGARSCGKRLLVRLAVRRPEIASRWGRPGVSEDDMAAVFSAVVADHTESLLPDDGSEADLARDGHVQDAWSE